MPPDESLQRVTWFTQMMMMYAKELSGGRLTNGEALKGLATVIGNFIADTAEDDKTIIRALTYVQNELSLFMEPQGLACIKLMKERREAENAIEERKASQAPLN